VCSSAAYAFYERYGVPRGRTYWGPLCADDELWTARAAEYVPQKAELKRALGLDPDLPVVLFVAHMRAVKRPLDLLEAFARLETKASLVMVGGGPMYDALKRRAAELPGLRARILEAANQSELPRYYAAGDVFALTSSYEPNGIVLREAMYFSLPMVLSDAITTVRDFVREGENGFSYPAGDVAALADRLDRVIEDPARTADMGRRSHEMIASWNYGVTVEGILAALRDVTARAR
jgi:glycosyltransferase involved in cell wall biosynthesis